MKVLFFVEPRIDLGRPYLREPWVKPFSMDMIDTLKKAGNESDFEFCITLNEPLGARHGDIEGIEKAFFTQEELNPPCVENWLEISAAWYKGTFTDEQISYFSNLVKSKLGTFAPDVVITFSPAPYLHKAFPEALVLHHEVSLFSRAPYPMTWYLDPLGMVFSKSSFPNAFSDEILKIGLDSRRRELLGSFKNRCKDLIRRKSPYDSLVAPIKEQYQYTALLPLSLMDIYSNKYRNKFKSHYDYIMFILSKIPPDVALLVVPHPDYTNTITEDIASYIKDVFPNFFYYEDISEYYAPSQYLLSYADLVIAHDSSLCFQALIWDKIVVNTGDVDFLSDASNLDNIRELLPGRKVDRDALLYWLLTRYAVTKKHLHDPQWLGPFLKGRLREFRTCGVQCDFFPAIADDEDVFETLNAGFDENVPQACLNFTTARLKKMYYELKAENDNLRKEIDSIDVFVKMRETIAKSVELFNDGRLDEASAILSGMLSGINGVKATVLNNMAVINVNKGKLEVARHILAHLIKEGYSCEEAAANLEWVNRMIEEKNSSGRLTGV